MVQKIGNYLEQLTNFNGSYEDEIVSVKKYNDSNKLFEKSVTLTAKMWPSDDDEDNNNWSFRVGNWTVRSEHIPIIVGIFTSAILIFVLITMYLIWRYCFSSKKDNDPGIDDIETVEKTVPPAAPSYSAVFLDPKDGNYIYNSRVIELIPEQEGCPYWLYKNHYLETIHISDSEYQTQSDNVDNAKQCEGLRDHQDEPSPIASMDDCSLPQISEFSAHPCQYASSSILEDCCSQNANLTHLKTRSLPSCVRLKKRPLSTVDNPAELYDKVNFSKKRKNRMRNDEAAIIALSKSRSQFFNKDTDILVDNEAVIVYDERTAL